MSFSEATQQVGKPLSLPSKRKIPARKKARPKALPAEWSIRAGKLTDHAHKALLENFVVLAWLRKERGLNVETVKRHRLGWLGQNHYSDREAWGLPELIGDNGNPKKLFIPSGLTIPHFKSGKVVRIRIRRDNPGEWGKYYVLPGSNMEPMVIGELKPWPGAAPAIITEGELDILLLFQEIESNYALVSMGSATVKPQSELCEKLRELPFIIVCLDADQAGDNGAEYWLKNFANAVWFEMPANLGKDPTEAFKNGLNLNTWLRAAMLEVDNLGEGGAH